MQWWCSAQGIPWSWTWRPYVGVWLLIAALGVAGWLFTRRTGRTRLQRVSFLTGLLLLWAALDWPIGTLGAGYLASVHMVQFLLIVFYAPPLILLGLLVTVFLLFEARRYRYFNVWRARCRLIETDVYVPMLRGEGVKMDGKWNTLLAGDYAQPHFHISFTRSIGRRLRKNYAYILAVQGIAYCGKLAIHPADASSFAEFVDRAAVGPLPGWSVLLAGVIFHGIWVAIAVTTLQVERRSRTGRKLISIA